MLYNALKRCIERNNYTTKEDMQEKISILFANNQLTVAQYQELMDLLEMK